MSRLDGVLRGERATEQLGRALGAALQPGDLVALDGDLGAGKTTLVRGLAAGCGVDPAAVRSPTFVLHHVYGGGRIVLHHVDCYRLAAGADLSGLDLDAMLEDGALAVEWAVNAPSWRAAVTLHLRLGAPDEHSRTVAMVGDAPPRLRAALRQGLAAT